jgi:hypothetical protein
MTAWLGLALYAEGRTDHAFLGPLLRRLVERIASGADRPVDVGHLEPIRGVRRGDYEAFAGTVRDLRTQVHLLFLHTDGGGDPDRQRRDVLDPYIRAATDAAEGAMACVCVVPVREMEAWPLADPGAILRVAGSTRDPGTLGLPGPAAVEALPYPKRALEEAFRLCHGGPGRRSRSLSAAAMLGRFGEEVDLEMLRRVPAFERLWAEASAAVGEALRLPPLSGTRP